MSTPIVGRELLALVKENPQAKRQELAAMAGYTRINRKGEEVIALTAFTDALLEAKGLNIKGEPRGRAALNETTVHAGGAILIGSIYVKKAGVGPGDIYNITVNETTGQIVLDLINRVEGSPLPVKLYERKPKSDKSSSSEMTEPSAA